MPLQGPGIKIAFATLKPVIDHPDVILQIIAHIAVPLRISANFPRGIGTFQNLDAVVPQKARQIDPGEIHNQPVYLISRPALLAPPFQNNLQKVLG